MKRIVSNPDEAQYAFAVIQR